MRTEHVFFLWLIAVVLTLCAPILAADSVNVTITYVSTGKPYTVGTALPNERIYIDRPIPEDFDGYRFLPDSLHTNAQDSLASTAPILYGAKFISTANDDKRLNGLTRHLEFTVDKPCTVFIAYDKRMTDMADWLQDGSWTQTSYTLSWGTPGITDLSEASPMPIYAKNFDAGTVTLGSNLSGPTVAPDAHYIPFIVQQKYSGGFGTETDPYQIATAYDLIALGQATEDYGKHFILTADIDLAGQTFTQAMIAPDRKSVV
jgi:hypothetical protein